MKKLLTITERIPTALIGVFYLQEGNDIDELIRRNLKLDEYDKFKILKMSQSTLDESNQENTQTLLIITLLIEIIED